MDVTKFHECYKTQKWNKEKLAVLLRFGRKKVGPWDDIDGDMPEDGDEDVLCALPELLAEMVRLRSRVADLEAFVTSIRDNYDCDQDSHKYKTPCRCCEASRLLSDKSQESKTNE